MSYLITVPISVKGTHIYDDRGILGAVGEQNSIGIRITFDESWDGLTKMLFWFSAYDHDTQVAEQVLTDDDLVEDRTYEIQVPAEAFLYPGTAALTIRGSKTTGDKTILYTTEYGKFQIAPSSNTVQDIEPQTVAASVLEQVTQLVNSATAHDASASASASSASASASAAGTSASNASTYAGNASASASSASGYSSSASASAQRAEQMATGAAANASAAASSETECKRIETAMDTIETQAQQAYSMASSVKATADAGGFKGEKGDKGDTGNTGAKGDKGDTGVQIVDDESEIEADSRVVIYDGEDEEYTLVEDIKINGNSIVTDGVGNIPKASASTFGATKLGDGLWANSSGAATVNFTDLTTIDNRVSVRALRASHIDYAVKSAMCDGRGASWSVSECTNAKKRIGMIGEFEVIVDTTLEEEMASVILNIPNLANYSEIRIETVFPVLTARTLVTYKFAPSEILIDYISSAGSTAYNHSIKHVMFFDAENSIGTEKMEGFRIMSDQAVQTLGAHNGNTALYALYNAGGNIANQSGIKITRTGNLPVGTKFRILGR